MREPFTISYTIPKSSERFGVKTRDQRGMMMRRDGLFAIERKRDWRGEAGSSKFRFFATARFRSMLAWAIIIL